MFLGGVLGAIAGGFINSAFANDSANRQADRNLSLMKAQNDMNVENYKNRYQWQVEDMRKAGLNPILSSNLGAGSVGSAGLAGVSMPSSGGGAGDVGASINTALARDLTRKSIDIEQQNANTAQFRAETERIGVENEAKNLESQVSFRDTQIRLMAEMQKFDQDLRSAWQDFAMENQNRLTELKAQETAATIRHMAVQDANLSTMAQVALRDVSVKEVLAKVAEENGISHRALEAAQAVCAGKQADFYEKYGKTQETQAELNRAQTALVNYKRSVAGVETVSDVMKGILSIAIAGKVGLDLASGGTSRIGF